MMKPPKEFFELVALFDETNINAAATAGSAENMAGRIIEGLPKESRKPILLFINELLTKDLSSDELEAVWNQADPEFYIITSGGARNFFESIRKALS